MDTPVEVPQQPSSNTMALNIVALIIILAIAGVGGYLYLKSNISTKPKTISTPSNSPTPYVAIKSSVVCYNFKDLNQALQNTKAACILNLNGTSKGAVPADIAKLT